MHCSVIEHGYDVIEFSNCSIEERGLSRVLLCSLKTKGWWIGRRGSSSEGCLKWGGGSLRDLSKNILKQGVDKGKTCSYGEAGLKMSPLLPPPRKF